ncbi:MAG: hypothetical protein KJO24_04115, partial [Gammaproteobacteria bacterium]|nr:hypothetical protein [Gammaproteobacteria bacterium]
MTEQLQTLDAMPSMMSLLPGIVKSLFRKGGASVPQNTFVLKNVAIDKAHLADYQKVCGFEKSPQLPLTYLHVLAFNLQVSMLLDEGCDFPLLG